MLDMADVGRVTWLCQQLDATQLLNQEPLPLSQSVLLSLMQQLGSDLSKVRPSCSLHPAHLSRLVPSPLLSILRVLRPSPVPRKPFGTACAVDKSSLQA